MSKRKRTKTFSVRLTDEEHESLNKIISKTGLTKSAFIRMVAKRYLPKEQSPPEYDEVISELIGICSDLCSSNSDYAKRLDKVILKLNDIFIVPDKIKRGDFDGNN